MDKRDLDSSLEELSPEERLMLSMSKRQEPQGQEHTVTNGSNTCGGFSGNPNNPSRFNPPSAAPRKLKSQMTSQTQTLPPGTGAGSSDDDDDSSSCSSSSSSLCAGEDEADEKPSGLRLQKSPKKTTCSAQHYHPRGNKGTNTNMSTDSSNSH